MITKTREQRHRICGIGAKWKYHEYRKVVRQNSARKLACPPFFLAKAHGLAHAMMVNFSESCGGKK